MRYFYLFQRQLPVIVSVVLMSALMALTAGGIFARPATAVTIHHHPRSYSWDADDRYKVPVRVYLTKSERHRLHVLHRLHLLHLAYEARQAQFSRISERSDTKASRAYKSTTPSHSYHAANGCYDPSGHLSDAQVVMVWECAGGPSWAASSAVTITWCESGHNTSAYNPSGATGLFQILGSVVPGNLYDAHINALNAVSKFKASGDSWAQWVCRA